jgi:hypothetical protein
MPARGKSAAMPAKARKNVRQEARADLDGRTVKRIPPWMFAGRRLLAQPKPIQRLPESSAQV